MRASCALFYHPPVVGKMVDLHDIGGDVLVARIVEVDERAGVALLDVQWAKEVAA